MVFGEQPGGVSSDPTKGPLSGPSLNEVLTAQAESLQRHTSGINDLSAANLAILEILIGAGATTQEDFMRIKAKYQAKIDQAAAQAREKARFGGS